MRVMRKQLVKRSLDMMEELAEAEDSKAYDLFWESFGRQLKLGCIEDQGNKEALAKLLRFASSQSGRWVGVSGCGCFWVWVFLGVEECVCFDIHVHAYHPITTLPPDPPPTTPPPTPRR